MGQLDLTYKISWFTGMGLSLLCVFIQVYIYIVFPSSRKLDQKLLTQLTAARLANTILEYVAMQIPYHPIFTNISLALYTQSDAALICWMFVFTKNLYDKVVLVFPMQNTNFVIVSVAVWILTLPIGVLCPFFIEKDRQTNLQFNYFKTFYDVYALTKFIILSFNLLFFCQIFIVAMNRRKFSDKKGFLRICFVSFILVSITSIQVFLTDLWSYFGGNSKVKLHIIFTVINSYQVLAITVLFVVLSKGTSESVRKKIVLGFKRLAGLICCKKY